jgi:rhodanese-related sulfurtransferase
MEAMMKKLSLTLALTAGVFAISTGVWGITPEQKISAPDLQKLLEAKTPSIAVYDANSDDIRAKDGMVPGAKKLSSYRKYALTELPQDKSTMAVFYCYNEQCTASHEAADRAAAAGYKNVRVMSDGIAGWKSKGLPTTQP